MSEVKSRRLFKRKKPLSVALHFSKPVQLFAVKIVCKRIRRELYPETSLMNTTPQKISLFGVKRQSCSWHTFCHVPRMITSFFIQGLIISASLSAPQAAEAQPAAPKPAPFRTLPVKAFEVGEKLNYRIHYGLVNAGTAELFVNKRLTLAGHDVYHIVAKGRSISSFDWAFKVRDTYETWMDANSSFPWLFNRDVSEGGYTIKQLVRFNHYGKKAITNNGTPRTVPENVQDLVSAFYYARNLDLSNLKVGEAFTIPVFLDDSTYMMRMKYAGRETVKTDEGTFRCQVYMPQLLQGRVFKNEEDMKIWVTDDQNRIPVKCVAEILIGSIDMTITGIKGLKYPLSSKVTKK